MKIALFGGSFNPFHSDHLSMIKAVQTMNIIDEIWIIPTNQNPFKTQIDIKDKDRIAIIRSGIKSLNNVKIKKIELNNSEPSRTINTIQKVKELYPSHQFYFMLGSDNLDSLHKWTNIEELIKLQTFLLFDRKNNITNKELTKYQAKKIKFDKNLLLSSSDIRQGKNLEKEIPSIVQYINRKGLYLKEKLVAQNITDERLTHSFNVGQKALELAKIYQVNQTEALIAGTLHDITKNWSIAQHLNFLQKYDLSNINEPPATLHSYTGALFLEKVLLFTNKRIINAVKYHTVGNKKMSKLAMIVFIADKISIERNYENIEYYRQLSIKNLEKCYELLLKNQYQVAIKKHGIDNIGENIKKSLTAWKDK